MTLFDTPTEPLKRSRKPVAGLCRPTWTKYDPKGHRHRCSECEEIAFETLPGPMPGIRLAHFSRRQDGTTRYYPVASSTGRQQ